MTKIFYFFLKSSVNDEPMRNPICTDNFIGDVGDYVDIDGVGYIIEDYAEEICVAEGDSLYW